MQHKWLGALASITMASMLASGASAQAHTWPTKPVRVITPWPAGGLTDISGRIVFQKISENLGQQFVMENRGGATGTIGADVVAKSPPDGYTLMVNSMTHYGNPFIYKKLPYDTFNDFVPIGMMVRQTGLVVVHPALPVRSVKDLVALARAHPGQLLYSSTGSGGFAHLSIVLLGSMTGTKMVDVPYKGGGPAMTGLISGETQVLVSTPAAAVPQLNAKRVRLIAVTSDTRLTAFPDTPTIAEGGVAGYEYTGWVGVFGPASVPRSVVDRMNTEIKRAIDSPDTKKRLEEFEPWTLTPEQMAERVKADYRKYGELMKLVGTKPQ